MKSNAALKQTSIDKKEITHFQANSATWWDENGVFKSLHQLNPVRIKYIRDHCIKHFGLDEQSRHSLNGLSILDIGCGGGLLSEPMARLGANVYGIDAVEENIILAQQHSQKMGLNIQYACTTAEEQTGQYDVVLAMEIVEHVANLASFITSCTKLVKPNGLIFISTINRTWKSFLLGIVAAEYVLGWVPKGTHQWNKFVTPKELEDYLAKNGFAITNQTGVILDPLRHQWILSTRNGVNYMLVAQQGEKQNF